MKKETFVYKTPDYDMNYLLFRPECEAHGDLPLLVFLHGAGERGGNVEHLFRHGVPKLIGEGREIPALVLCPQCPAMYVWDNVVAGLRALIDKVVLENGISKDRICLTGNSMGGFGTWMMGLTYPSFFAAIAPVAGGGMSWRTEKLKTTPVLAVHGDADATVPISYSSLMVDGVNSAGGNARLITLEGKGHNDGIDYAYRHTELLDWLLAQRRTDFSYVPEVCESMF